MFAGGLCCVSSISGQEGRCCEAVLGKGGFGFDEVDSGSWCHPEARKFLDRVTRPCGRCDPVCRLPVTEDCKDGEGGIQRSLEEKALCWTLRTSKINTDLYAQVKLSW